MENMETEGQSPTEDVEPTNDLHEMKTVNAESSNEETEEETEHGQQDHEEVDTMMAEMDGPERKHLGEVQKNYSEGELRILNDLKKLSPPVLAAEIEHLEKELYHLSQREAREIIRSKHLENFCKNKRRISK